MKPKLRLLGSPMLEPGDEMKEGAGAATGNGVGAVARDLPVDKPAALLYYLAVRGDWVRRAELAYLIRPDAPESVALANVRVLLHRAKSVAPSELEIERGRVRWSIDTDVADFRGCLASGEDARALELYSGSFLAGVNVPESPGLDAWVDLERAELHNARRAAALRLSSGPPADGTLTIAAEHLKAVLADDPFDEEVLQAYLRVLFAAGRGPEAKAAYDGLTRSLAAELGAQPLESTVELFETLSSGTAARTPQAPTLPRRTTRFHGRREEQTVLDGLLARPETRLVTLTGLGGVGKSRLALEFASGRVSNHQDEIWFVELAGVAAPELLPQAIAATSQVDLSNYRDARVALFDRLRDRRALLILDNFEHLVAGADLLTDLLSEAPNVKLLVTSRTALGLAAETILELGGLGVPPRGAATGLDEHDAVALFIDRATRLSPGFVASGRTLEAVAELTRRVEGMPLALELAATRTRTLTMPELLAALERNLDVLSGTLRELPERQRSVRTVIDHSFELLTEAERRALVRLSVFHGGFDSRAAEQVADVHHGLLFGLVAHSLISRSTGGRFHVHELVRQFAAARLSAGVAGDDSPASEEAVELREAHARYYLGLQAERAEELGTSSRAIALGELGEEFDNIRAALAEASHSFSAELLSPALPAVFAIYLETGALRELISILEELEEEATQRVVLDEPLGLVIRQQLARADMARADFAAARDRLEPLLPLLQKSAESGDAVRVEALVRALDWLGSSARIMGDLEAAEHYVGEALAIARADVTEQPRGRADRALLADVMYNLASLRLTQGRVDEGRALLEESLSTSLAAGDDVRAARYRLALARLLLTAAEDLDSAQLHLDEALGVGRATRSVRLEAAALNALAVLADRRGDKSAADRYHLESLALATQQGQSDDLRVALANLGGLLNDQGRFDEAAVYLRRALEKALVVKNPSALNQTYSLLGANSSARGDHDGAAAYFLAALEAKALTGLPAVNLTQCLSLLAKTHDAAGRTPAARSLRVYLLEEPATPPPIKAKLEAALAKTTNDGLEDVTYDLRPSLQEMAALQRDMLRSRDRA